VPAAAGPAAPAAYRPDIDGLRAWAVAIVVGFHAFPTLVPGGFIGVDVFFVISGYLITGLLLQDLAQSRFGMAGFYARRVRRLFPALLLVLACTLAAGWALLVADEWRQLGRHALAGLGFASNLLLWRETGYFDAAAHTKPLLHLWSLAIEEQFYLVWPLLLAWAWRRGWPLRRAVAAVVLVSLAVGLVAVQAGSPAAFYSPLARLWELGLGAWLACRPTPGAAGAAGRRRPGRLALQAAAGVSLMLAGLVFIRPGGGFPGAWALLPVLGTVLLIAAGPQAAFNRRLLGHPLAVGLGRISYPLYLWHWPVLVLLQITLGHEPPRGARVAAVLCSVVLAWLTWRWVEQPLRHQGRRVAAGLLAVAVAAALALLPVLGGQLLPRSHEAGTDDIVAARQDWAFPHGLMAVDVEGVPAFRLAGTAPGEVLWLGDSHVEQYAPRLVALAGQGRRLPSSTFVTAQGCPLIPGVLDAGRAHRDCPPRRAAGLARARASGVSTVVIGGCWACYLAEPVADEPGGRNDYTIASGGERLPLRTSAGRDAALAALEDLLRDLARSHRVLLLLDNPQGPGQDPAAFLSGSRLTGLVATRPAVAWPLPADQAALDTQLRALASRAGVQVIAPIDHWCPGGACRRADAAGRPLYKDASHLRASVVRAQAGYIDVALQPAD